MKKKLAYIIEAALAAMALAPLGLLPGPLSAKAGAGLGLALNTVLGKRSRLAQGNVASIIAVGGLGSEHDPKAVVRECFSRIGVQLSEISKLYIGLDRALIEGTRVTGMEHFQEARAQGKGVIMVTGHIGNWEMNSAILSTYLQPGSRVVAKRQKNPYINAMIERMRQGRGSVVVYKEGAIKAAIRVLRDQGLVGLVVDEVVKPDMGVEVRFLGQPTVLTSSPSALAKRTGSPVLAAHLKRHPRGGHVFAISPIFPFTGDPVGDTQMVADYFSAIIKDDPACWMQWLRKWPWRR